MPRVFKLPTGDIQRRRHRGEFSTIFLNSLAWCIVICPDFPQRSYPVNFLHSILTFCKVWNEWMWWNFLHRQHRGTTSFFRSLIRAFARTRTQTCLYPGHCCLFNPLNPRSDWHVTSPNDIHTSSSKQVMRILKLNRHKLLSI